MSSIIVAGDTSGTVTLQAPSVAGTTTLTLPSTSGTILTSASSVAASQLPTGSVLQVVQATFLGTQTITASGYANWTDVTSLSATITPSSSSNKILLIAQITASLTSDRICFARFAGGNSGNYIGNTNGSRARVATFSQSSSASGGQITCPINMTYLDSPATTSATTYKVQIAPNYSSGNIGINYAVVGDADLAYLPTAASSLIVMEIKG